MNTKTSLAILLTALLLTGPLNGLNWQGTGSGMNSTVIAEIWTGLESNIGMAFPNGNINSNA